MCGLRNSFVQVSRSNKLQNNGFLIFEHCIWLARHVKIKEAFFKNICISVNKNTAGMYA